MPENVVRLLVIDNVSVKIDVERDRTADVLCRNRSYSSIVVVNAKASGPIVSPGNHIRRIGPALTPMTQS